MAKVYKYKGKTVEELKELDLKDFIKLIPANQRRTLTRGFTEEQKKLLLKIDKALAGKYKRSIKTHCRDLIILPKMVGLTIHIHNGKVFNPVEIQPEMISHRLGEFSLTRGMVKHNAPGIGATRSSAYASVK